MRYGYFCVKKGVVVKLLLGDLSISTKYPETTSFYSTTGGMIANITVDERSVDSYEFCGETLYIGGVYTPSTPLRIQLTRDGAVYCFNDDSDGDHVEYHDNGIIKKTYTLKNHEVSGYVKIYSEEGGILEEYEICNGGKVDIEKEYFNDQTLKSETKYIAGLKEGESIHYYPSGEVMAKQTFHNDVLHGVYEQFYEDGNIMTKGVFRDGLLDGIYKIFYRNNLLKYECMFDSGKKVGCEIMYSPDGKKTIMNV